jgi:hypothetical protein
MSAVGAIEAVAASALVVPAAGCSTTADPQFQAYDDCPKSIAQYCSGSNSAACTQDYATAKQQASVCIPNNSGSHFFAESCSGFNVLTDTNVDVGTTAYYSVADGKLVALVDYQGGRRSAINAMFPRIDRMRRLYGNCVGFARPLDRLSPVRSRYNGLVSSEKEEWERAQKAGGRAKRPLLFGALAAGRRHRRRVRSRDVDCDRHAGSRGPR